MLIKMLKTVPLQDHMYIAYSGGADSMAMAYFFSRRRKVTLVHFNHQTPYAAEAERLARLHAAREQLDIIVGHADSQSSSEAAWRSQRYRFFASLGVDIYTGHNLNDAAETWLHTAIRFEPRLIPAINRELIAPRAIYRPWITVPRANVELYCEQHGLQPVVDPSNEDPKYSRNRIRHNILPEALKINPGLLKMVAHKYQDAQ